MTSYLDLVSDLVSDLVLDLVTHLVSDLVSDFVSDLVSDLVSELVSDLVSDLVFCSYRLLARLFEFSKICFPCLSTGWGHCVDFLGKTLNSQCLSPPGCVNG